MNMNEFLNKVGKNLEKVTQFLPTALPKGVTAFNEWAASVLELAGPSIPDNDSTRFALAAAIINLGATTDRKAKYFFVKTLRAAAAKQIAADVFYTLKKKQQEEAIKAQAEATAKKDASNGQQQQLSV